MVQLGQHIHLVGIGGAGLSAIARILLERGHQVSGSDRNRNALMDALARDGAAIYEGHDASYISGANSVIISSAVQPNHVEVAAARAQNIPVYKRSDIMASLMDGKRVIAVAGTHGKTTTTAMIVHILRECGKDPSYIVGGIMRNTGTNAGVGQGDCFVIEADEYDNMFHGLKPDIAVVTNVEYDHPDFFKSREELVASFEKFVDLLAAPSYFGGLLVACVDDPVVENLSRRRGSALHGFTVMTYGLVNEAAYIQAESIHVNAQGLTQFDISYWYPTSNLPRRIIGSVKQALHGKHNVSNALAALTAVLSLDDEDITVEAILNALGSFQGTGRRFELRDEIAGVAVIDDYAHHPTAIKVTLDAARHRYPDREIWAVWQPHTYSRTQALMDEYMTAFGAADHVLITDIYAARETTVPGVTSAGIIARMTHGDVRHTPTFEDTISILDQEVQAPAVILIMSAGDAPTIGIEVLRRRQERHETANLTG